MREAQVRTGCETRRHARSDTTRHVHQWTGNRLQEVSTDLLFSDQKEIIPFFFLSDDWRIVPIIFPALFGHLDKKMFTTRNPKNAGSVFSNWSTFWLQSHFSIKRAGMILGIGLDNVVLIKSDERFAD